MAVKQKIRKDIESYHYEHGVSIPEIALKTGYSEEVIKGIITGRI